ncbi:hypothetical protein F5884DRAFT_327023 [Xylogone sp. PMI_703]|nr:hypothetical protein F5884DRAFT_327023 [Xylogone sp. PMI_703]
MSDLAGYDDDNDLLNRFNALKKSSAPTTPIKQANLHNTRATLSPDTDLSARLRGLRNGSLSPAPVTTRKVTPVTAHSPSALPPDDDDPLLDFGDDDQTLEELLADLGPEDQWKLNPDDPNDIQKLLDEAKQALPRPEVSSELKPEEQSQDDDRRKTGKDLLTRDLDMPAFTLDDEDQDDSKRGRNTDLEKESREVQDIVAKALDEVKTEGENEATAGGDDEKPTENNEEDGEDEEKDGDHSTLDFPTTPSDFHSLPPASEPGRQSPDSDSGLDARLAALRGLGPVGDLSLPSVPASKPTGKQVQSTMKKFTDEEIDSWCIICQDDATIECLGCDSDLYCANCWKEGHMGPDVGLEEKMHKWVKYRKPT